QDLAGPVPWCLQRLPPADPPRPARHVQRPPTGRPRSLHPPLQAGPLVRYAADLFCGAGGTTRGLQLAGYYVVGVDSKAQPRYCGDRFVKGDALALNLDAFDLVVAGPPCQRYSQATPPDKKGNHPDLID